MKNDFLPYFVVLLFLGSCGIAKKPLYTKQTDNNKDYDISYLFEHDGCRVYRFIDNGNCVYFTSCQGNTTLVRDSTGDIRATTIIK